MELPVRGAYKLYIRDCWLKQPLFVTSCPYAVLIKDDTEQISSSMRRYSSSRTTRVFVYMLMAGVARVPENSRDGLFARRKEERGQVQTRREM